LKHCYSKFLFYWLFTKQVRLHCTDTEWIYRRMFDPSKYLKKLKFVDKL
jgi:hypothetical protein